jgi:hypothetical protein
MTQWDHQYMRTTLTLDDDIYAKLDAEARKSGESYKKVVNDLLRQALLSRCHAKTSKILKVHSRPLGRRPDLNYDNIGELIQRLEGSAHS